MCGRYTLHHSPDQVALRFHVEELLAAPTERYNIAPTQPVAVVVQHDAVRTLDAYRWGLIPAWAKDPDIGSRLINARAETLAEKPAFKQALVKRRCILPADGFYEWQKLPSGRQPYRLHRKDDALFGFAGLWEEWKQADGTPLRTCTIITVAPNEVAAQVHDRMPAILRPEDEALWLDPSVKEVSDLLHVLNPYPSEAMEAYAVSKRVNAPMTDDPALLFPV
jgi:putative SOS response-associated peptidase YedK